MSNLSTTTGTEPQPTTHNSLSTWDEARRFADEIELKLHLASMDARDRWRELAPRLEAFEQRMKDAGERAGKAISYELEALWKSLRSIRDDIANGN